MLGMLATPGSPSDSSSVHIICVHDSCVVNTVTVSAVRSYTPLSLQIDVCV
jgi:hypothetical protein